MTNTSANMGIYASMAGHYKFAGRTSREQYIFNQQEFCQCHTCINTFTLNQMLKKMDLPQHLPPVKVPWQVRLLERYGKQANECPYCHQPTLKLLAVVYPRAGLIELG